MKYVFFGTPRFAEIVLGRLIAAGMPPIAVVCNPDRPIGRKKVLTVPPTKKLAQSAGKDGVAIKIFQPEKLDADLIRELKAFDAEFFIVAAYAKIIPKAILDIPRLGTIGVHPSLLPKYRGASPIQSVILEGETETGASIYRMDDKMDHGSVLGDKKMNIDSLNIAYPTLEEKLAELSASLLIKTMPEFVAGKLKPGAQDESLATYTKKFTTQDGFVDEKDLVEAEHGDEKKARTIVRKINAFTPEPGAWTQKDGKRVKLLGAIIQNGSLKLSKIQEEGGKPKLV